MKWIARKVVRCSPPSDGEWKRWFAWYPVMMATANNSAHWVWLEFVERKWSTDAYGYGVKKRRYRLPKLPEVRQRLRNLSELARKLWSGSPTGLAANTARCVPFGQRRRTIFMFDVSSPILGR